MNNATESAQKAQLSFCAASLHLAYSALDAGLAVIQRRHVLRNAILPIVTLAGLQAGQMVGGAILTETVFAWPGIGRLMFEALLQRDYNLLLGIFFVSAAMVILFNLVTDLIYRVADPRIEVGA